MHDQHIAIKTIDPNEVFVLSAEEHHAIEHENTTTKMRVQPPLKR